MPNTEIVCAGRLSSVVAGDMPSALGLAAGLTAWLGAADLGYQAIFGRAGSLGTTLMGAAAGGLAVVALCRLQGHWLGSGDSSFLTLTFRANSPK